MWLRLCDLPNETDELKWQAVCFRWLSASSALAE
jgi:hypothetical protein